MENITSTAALKNAIQLLEIEQAANGQLLKQQFHITYESLTPVNLLKSSLHDIVSSPIIFDNILGTVLTLTTGYISKRIIVGKSVNRYRKLIGSVLQLAVTKLISRNPDAIRSLGMSVFQRLFHKRKQIPT